MEGASEFTEKLHVRCCIAGGGPAGMTLGLLLARAGVDVVVLEKHADFLRDFRGDTLHPSTLEMMHELGMLEDLLKRPHQKVRQWKAQMGDSEIVLADFSRLTTQCRFIALMPQWDFLDFLAGWARRYPTFHLRMQAEVTGLIEANDGVAGLRAQTPDGPLEISAELVIGADGRHSVVRTCSGLRIDDLGAPIDVLWMRLSKNASDPQLALRFDRGKILAMLDRGDYWQCGFVIPKGGSEEMRQKGIEHLRSGIAEIAPFFSDRVSELRDWSEIKLLTVRVDRLRQWYRPGLLCIGDAAHAMSPIGGIGINLAIQDAVATANILAGPLRGGALTADHLAAVQRRRAFATRLTQGFQAIIQKQLVARVLATSDRRALPWPQRLLNRSKPVRWIRGRIIGIGFRPEHVKTPALYE
jgi:2-polyprenyl-6-methoxyphenol hydroxylase-like FAD-dependent oxidoreductase